MKRFSLYLYNVVHGKKVSVFGYQFLDLIMKVGKTENWKLKTNNQKLFRSRCL